MSYTYVTLDLSPGAFAEISTKLRAAGYHQAFHTEGLIDMHGIAVGRETANEDEVAIPVIDLAND